MTLNFASLTQKVRAGGALTAEDILDIIEAGPGATFALVEFAAEFRRTFFKNSIEIANLLDANQEVTASSPEGRVLEVGSEHDSQQLAQRIYELAHDDAVGRVTVNFLVPAHTEEGSPAANLTPMYCLRVLAALRLTAPAKSLRLGQGRTEHLRSLQSLSLHTVDSFYLSDYRASEPTAIFEDLKLIKGAGLLVEGAENRDLGADYATYLQGRGVEDAHAYAKVILADEEEENGGGCGGCGCGSGGCGSK